ncbi:MAG: hypothetical protein EBU08_20940, partial [Micrococcales bacterium]|nr:hypothetical protein [Micrococcales bacterium]
MPASSAFAYSTGAFTIEFWVYPNSLTSTGGDNPQVFTQTASGQNYVMCGFNSSGAMSFFGSGTALTGTAGDVVANRWQHLAYVRESTSSNGFKMYVDGVLKFTGTMSVDFTNTSFNPTIGNYTHGSVGGLNGYVSNLRVTKGRAVYTSAFTPPETPLTRTTGGTNPPQGTECSWLTCQSNRFLDSNGPNIPASSPLTITITNDPSVQAFSPFNPSASWSAATYGGSGYFDGSGDYLNVASNAAFNIESGAYTIESFVYFNALSFSSRILVFSGGGSTVGFIVGSISPNDLEINRFGTGPLLTATNALVGVTNSWAHVCVVSNGTNRSIFVNGTRYATTTSSLFPSANNEVGIGGIGGTYAGANPNAYFSNARIVKGTAVYDPTQT